MPFSHTTSSSTSGASWKAEPLPRSPRFVDLTGSKDYGRWEVLGYAGKRGKTHYWWCRCGCGKVKKVCSANLVGGRTESCGCLRGEVSGARWRTHGKSKTRTYKIWCGLISRCYDEGNSSYEWYGRVGVTVCDRWRGPGGFERFLADMGEAPVGMTIERKENNRPYEPGNCVWASTSVQARNRKNTVRLTIDGVTKCAADWADEYRIGRKTLYFRLRSGWSPEEAVKTPVG